MAMDFVRHAAKTLDDLQGLLGRLGNRRGLHVCDRAELMYAASSRAFLSLVFQPVGTRIRQSDDGLNRKDLKWAGKEIEDFAARTRKRARDVRVLRAKATGAHAAGKFLDQGRHSEIHVDKRTLLSALDGALGRLCKAANLDSTDQQHLCRLRAQFRSLGPPFREAFLSLFNYVYYHISGRQHTLVHYLLSSSSSEAQTFCIHARRTAISHSPSGSRSSSVKVRILSFDSEWEHLAHDNLLDKIIATVAIEADTYHSIIRQRPNSMTIAHYGARLVKLFGKEESSERIWYCVKHTLDHLDQANTELFSETWIADVNGQFHDHEKRKEQYQRASMMRLFLLYREFCGKVFYVLVPSSDGGFRTCYTLGVDAELPDDLLLSITTFASSLARLLRKRLKALKLEPITKNLVRTMNYHPEWTSLQKKIGIPAANWLDQKFRKHQDDHRVQWGHEAIGGLFKYLWFAEKISEVAVHEGKSLRFDIMVGDGLLAADRLERLSPLPLGPWELEIQSKGNELQIGPKTHEYVSRLIGNFAFFQTKGAVLYGDRHGRLKWFARLLDTTQSPEKVTQVDPRSGKASACYFLRVDRNGDVFLFFAGEVFLWRRSGEYIIPKLYGKEYCKALADWLGCEKYRRCSGNVDFDVLAKVAWSLSHERHEGGCFVLGKMADEHFPLSIRTISLTDLLPYVDGMPLVVQGNEDLLQDLAIQDGAVIVDVTTGNVYGRRQLLPADRGHLEPKLQAIRKNWSGWHKTLRWGTRHHSSLAFALSADEAKCPITVITVSRDGDIHVFDASGPVKAHIYP